MNQTRIWPPLLPHLFEMFLAETWEYRDRVIPVKAESVDGMQRVAGAGLQPEVVYVDADHSDEQVLQDVSTALDLFPRARIVGDDWDWPGVRRAVEQLVSERRLKLEIYQTAWRIVR
jgi:hypothetical protein